MPLRCIQDPALLGLRTNLDIITTNYIRVASSVANIYVYPLKPGLPLASIADNTTYTARFHQLSLIRFRKEVTHGITDLITMYHSEGIAMK